MEEAILDNDELGSTSGRDISPQLLQDSPESSVSTRLQEEYTELLKYTVNSVTLNGDDIETGNVLESHQVSKPGVNSGDGHLQVELNANQNAPTHEFQDTKTKFQVAPNSQSSMDLACISMGSKLDCWLGELKGKVLSELSSVLITVLESQSNEQRKEINELTSEKARLEKELNKLLEKINGMEQSIDRKDTLIDNLTQSLAAQKEKTEVAQKFYAWKSNHHNNEREKFTTKLASQHHNRTISHKVFKSWFGLVQRRWRSKVERVCQEQAQGVCLQLTNDYEAKVSSLNDTIKTLEARVNHLQEEKQAYTDQVRKAFMRGVCALNNEAMSAFNPEQQPSDSSFFGGGNSYGVMETSLEEVGEKNVNSNLAAQQPSKDTLATKSLPSEMSIPSSCDFFSKPLVKDCSQPKSLMTTSHFTSSKTKAKSGQVATKPKQQSVPICPASSKPLAPPMASVVVEKHQPVTKQTIGKATAVRYPKPQPGKTSKGGSQGSAAVNVMPSSSRQFKPLAGQMATLTNENLLKTQAMSVKVVD